MKIGVWSAVPGKSCVTSNLLSIALYNSIRNDKSCVCLQTQFKNNNLSSGVLKPRYNKSSLVFSDDNGIDMLFRKVKGGASDKMSIESCAHGFLRGKFCLIDPTGFGLESTYNSNLHNLFLESVDALDQFYDYTFIDIKSGIDKFNLELFDTLDLLIVCFEQNYNTVHSYFDKIDRNISNDKILYLFGNFDNKSTFNMNNIRNKFPKINSYNSSCIVHDTCFLDSFNESTLIKFFLNNIDRKKDHPAYNFISSVDRSVSKMNAVLSATRKKEGRLWA